MSPLPLGDRILVAVAHQRHTPRSLARLFRKDPASLDELLAELGEQDLITQAEQGDGTVLELAEGVSVEYRPGRILVDKAGEDTRTTDGSQDRCMAVTASGSRCKMKPVADGVCQHHTP